MRTYFVSYDLRGSDENSSDYRDLIDAIKSYGYYAKLMLSTWLIVTDENAKAIRDYLWQHMDENDRLFVGPAGRPAAWENLLVDYEWMKERP